MIKQKLGDFKTSQIEILKNRSITELVDETVKDQLKEIEVMFSKESFKEIKKILKKDKKSWEETLKKF